jgi:hypothetical protein
LSGRTYRAAACAVRLQGFSNGGALQINSNTAYAGAGNLTLLKPFFLDMEQFLFLTGMSASGIMMQFGRLSVAFAVIQFGDPDARNVSITDNKFYTSMLPFTPASSNIFVDIKPNLQFSTNTTVLNSATLAPKIDFTLEFFRNEMFVDSKYQKTAVNQPSMSGIRNGMFVTQNVLIWCSPFTSALGFPPTGSKYYSSTSTPGSIVFNEDLFSLVFRIENNKANFQAGQHTPFVFVNTTATILLLLHNSINVTQSGSSMYFPQYWVSPKATTFLVSSESGSALYSMSNSFLLDTFVMQGNKFNVNHLVGVSNQQQQAVGGVHLPLAGKVLLMTCGTAVDHQHESGANSPGKCFAFQTTLIEQNELKMNVSFVDPSSFSSQLLPSSSTLPPTGDSSFHSSFTIGLVNATTASMPFYPDQAILISRNRVTVIVNETTTTQQMRSKTVNNDQDNGRNMLTSALPGSTFLLQLVGERMVDPFTTQMDAIHLEHNQMKCFTVMKERFNPSLTETVCSFVSSRASALLIPPAMPAPAIPDGINPTMGTSFTLSLDSNTMNVNLYNSYNPSWNSTNFYLVPFMLNFHTWGTFYRAQPSSWEMLRITYPFFLIVFSPAPSCNIFNIYNQTTSLLYYKSSVNTSAVHDRYGFDVLASDGNKNVCLPTRIASSRS